MSEPLNVPVGQFLAKAIAKETNARAVLLLIVHKDKIGPNGSNTELALGVVDPTLSTESLIDRLEKLLTQIRGAARVADSASDHFAA